MRIVLLTGASGFIGQWIARLCPPHYSLRLLTRPSGDLSLLQQSQIPFERVDGDLTEPATLRRALRGVDAVIHAAGRISFDRRRAAEIHTINATGTAALFAAALEAGVHRVVYTASIFALGHTNPHLVTENATFQGEEFLDIPYIRAKIEAEAAAQQLIQQGLPLVRLYPGICLGPGDLHHSSNGFIVGWRRGLLPALVDGGICFIDVRDAAAAHWRALENGKIGERYLAPGYNLTHRQFFEIAAWVANKPAPPFTVPAAVGVLGGAFYERWLPSPPLYRDEARLMARRWWYDDRLTRQRLAIAYRPLAETLRDTFGALDAESKKRKVVGR